MAISTPVFIKGERVRIDRAVDGTKETREERYPLDQQFHGSLIGVAGRTVCTRTHTHTHTHTTHTRAHTSTHAMQRRT